MVKQIAVAIQSTYEKLKEQLDPDCYTEDERKLRDCYVLGEVGYMDYEADQAISEEDVFTPFMCKRKEYEHEQEIRALVMHMRGNQTSQGYILKSVKEGIRKKVDVQNLVESIRVRVGTKEWIRDTIEDICRKYGKEIRIENSELDQKPLL